MWNFHWTLPIHIFVSACLNGVISVRIRELNVPELVELGTENILLDCDFDYNENEKYQLDIKWYFNGEPSPFFQWVPGQMSKPQIIGERFRDHIDLDHSVHADSYKSHRALLLKKPSLELSGIYTCKVSTFVDEDVKRKKMTVFSPASSVSFQQERLPTGRQVNVSCTAKGIYPRPEIRLTWGSYQLDDSEASLTSADHENGAFDIVVHRLIDHEELPSETIFGCVLTIPGTSYRVREESIYRHRSGRYSHQVSSGAKNGPQYFSIINLLFTIFCLKAKI